MLANESVSFDESFSGVPASVLREIILTTFISFDEKFVPIAASGRGHMLANVSTSFDKRFFDAPASVLHKIILTTFTLFDEVFFDAPATVLREIISSVLISHDAISSALLSWKYDRPDIGVPILRAPDWSGIINLAHLDCANLEIDVLITRTLDMTGNVHLADLACATRGYEGASALVAYNDDSGLMPEPYLLVANGVGEDICTSIVRISTGELLFGEDVRVQISRQSTIEL